RRPADVYVFLLARLGRDAEALEAAIHHFSSNQPAGGMAPSLLELAARSGQYDRLCEFLKTEGDLLTFAAAVVEQQAAERGA
ncbi:MAG: hypothetical protein VX431_00880, partial [Planctomycetota bacterium]|nr:hypothetical protein [Planctomycetota bacterium]